MNSPIFLDTSCFIYLVEKSSNYFIQMRGLFDNISIGKYSAFSSIITLSEVLVKPLRDKDEKMTNNYMELINQMPNFTLLSPQITTAIEAAKIRAELNIQLPDAHQLALAKEYGCKSFLTNDRNLKRFKGLKILVLDEFV